MDYPTQKGKLIMPEYGRNIQQMVDYALTIEDKEERTRCVHSIIHTMGNLFPYLRDISDFKHKLWDHLAIMSDFKLDIDFPYGEPEKAALSSKPEPVPYFSKPIRCMHYGRMVDEMIQKALLYEDGEEKQALVCAIANQMKRNFLLWNKDMVEDAKIWADLLELSGGKLRPAEGDKLWEAKDILGNGAKKKNNNNKNLQKKNNNNNNNKNNK